MPLLLCVVVTADRENLGLRNWSIGTKLHDFYEQMSGNLQKRRNQHLELRSNHNLAGLILSMGGRKVAIAIWLMRMTFVFHRLSQA